MPRRLLLLALLVLLAPVACDRLPTGPRPAEPIESVLLRHWRFATRHLDGRVIGDGWHEQEAGVVSDRRSHAEVYSNQTGQTYWVEARAPSILTAGDNAIGTDVELWHRYGFRKTSPDAYIRFEITRVLLDALDGNPAEPSFYDCPWFRGGAEPERCRRTMEATVSFHIELFFRSAGPVTNWDPCHEGFSLFLGCLWRLAGAAAIYGWHGNWELDAWTHGDSDNRLWDESDFRLDPAVGGSRTAARVELLEPRVIEVPLDVIEVGEEVYVYSRVIAEAWNFRQGESHISAFFRDPASGNGLGLSYHGVEPVPAPPRPENRRTGNGPTCAPGTSPAGTVQFARPIFADPEVLGRGRVVVSRTGGSAGALSALLTTGGGTATPGVDYTPVSTVVLFADGEEGERVVEIPLLNDTIAEPDESIDLTLSTGNGCATIGSPAQATLTIMDDDTPPPTVALYSVGGTVSGLVGSGLELTLNALTGRVAPSGNGPFAFAQRLLDGLSYNVVIDRQPSQPDQACTVANGAGHISGADVTNIAVTCAPPATAGGLDPGFGSAGRVTAGLPEGARRIALQPDGRIVAAGGRTLTRYLPNGALDASFGTGGQVTVRLNLDRDELRGVALQPDGKIVVAGHGRSGVNSPTDFDIGVARFHADGSPDTGFGDQGQVTIDFHGESDTAEEVLIQPDGSIVVVGSARNRPGGILNADFAVLRLAPTGALDTGFGENGKVMTDIAGQTDLPAAALLQPDGRIVVGGRVGRSGGDSPDMTLVRYNTDGTLDTGFGVNGIARVQTPGVWDEVQGLALQPDGKLIAVGNENRQSQGSPTTFKVVRFLSNGSLDTGFGTNGVVTDIPFSTHGDFGHAVAVQADGRIVVVGLASRLEAPDLAIARLNADGTMNTVFGIGGLMTVDFFGGHDQANAVLIQPDGAIVAAGSAVNGANTGMGMVRVRAP